MPALSKASSRQILRALAPHQEFLQNFSGGLNLRDSPLELASNESPLMLNMTIDERGGVSKRLGASVLGLPSGETTAPAYAYFSEALQLWFVYYPGGKFYKFDGAATWTLLKTFAAGSAAFTDFKGELVICHSVEGVFTSTGVGAPTVRAAGVLGACIAVWQNKVWVGGDPANKQRVWWSNIGDSHTWTVATDFVDVREGGDGAVTALGTGNGMDILGRAGLLVFKARSCHRINSSSTGSYTTLSLLAGASCATAVATNGLITVFVNDVGIWQTDSVASPVLISGKVSPLFDYVYDGATFYVGGDFSSSVVWYAGGRFWISYGNVKAAGNANDGNAYVLEHHPDQGWFVPHHFPFSVNGGAGMQGSPLRTWAAAFVTGSNSGLVRLGNAGTDTVPGGAPTHIVSTFRTRSFVPGGGLKQQLGVVRLIGRGQFTVAPIFDFATAAGTARVTNVVTPSKLLGFKDLFELGHPRAAGLEFVGASADDTVFTYPIVGSVLYSRMMGGWGLAGALLDFVGQGQDAKV